MKRKYNKNLLFLIESFRDNRGAVLEGSSRSGKTYSSIDFVIYLCSKHEDPITINIIKETYNSFKTTLYDDFSKRLTTFGLDNPFERSKEVSTFRIFNHKINFLGADVPSKFHGASSDYTWYNEALDISNDIFDQSEMRCRIFWWMDYNPSTTSHFVYDKVIPRPDVAFLKTTYKDNPYISEAELNKIKSYEPTDKNIQIGTADDYMWNVYGLGERMARQGLIFQNVTWINDMPKEADEICYGLDFGYVNDPCALVKIGRHGNNIYIELLMYEPTSSSKYLAERLKEMLPENPNIWADSADPIMITDLRVAGLRVFAIKKFSGSIKYGIGLINSHKVHMINNKHLRREQENYTWKEVNGIPLDQPIDKWNHAFDAARYAAMANYRTR